MFSPVKVGKRTRYSYARIKEVMEMPHLLDIQRKSYEWFLREGLEEILRDISPISDFNGNLKLFFGKFKLGEPKNTLDECKERDGTYSAPIRVNVQLVNNDMGGEVKEQEVFMGDFPLMTETGTFVINGAERVIVSQLVRSPGAYYGETMDPTGKKIFTATVIPNRGAWIELETDANNNISVRIDRTRKMPVTYFLRALGFETDEEILELFGYDPIIADELERESEVDTRAKALGEIYRRLRPGEPIPPVENSLQLLNSLFFDPKRYDLAAVGRYKITKKLGLKRRLIGKTLADDIVDFETGEVLIQAVENVIDPETGKFVIDEETGNPVVKYHVITAEDLEKIDDDREEEIFGLTPDKVHRGYFTPIPIKIKTENGDMTMLCAPKLSIKDNRTICVADIVSSIGYMIDLINGVGTVDDIDHLGNRRVRSVGELLQNQFRIGLARMERVVRERMTIQDSEIITPQILINIRPVVAAIKEFFGSSQLSQFMDQHNPLSELTHKRRLSALGPGGLSRERAGFEVRDVHNSHYGRMCPIETPEGPNIGLIGSLSNYARVNRYGFMETPYRKVDAENHRVTGEVRYLTADEEETLVIAQANEPLDQNDWFVNERVTARVNEETTMVRRERVDYMDVSPKQVVSIATAMIPFLENDDANRALMGANMQRQAVPLLRTQAPLVGTGMEYKAACDSGVMVLAENAGTVTYVDSSSIQIKIIPVDRYVMPDNNYIPLTKKGVRVKAGDVLAKYGDIPIIAKREGTVTSFAYDMIQVALDSEEYDLPHGKIKIMAKLNNQVREAQPLAQGGGTILRAKRAGLVKKITDEKIIVEPALMYDEYLMPSDFKFTVTKGERVKKDRILAEGVGAVCTSRRAGKIVDIDDAKKTLRLEVFPRDEYKLQKFVRSNQGTCINQTPLVDKGEYVEVKQPIADGPATNNGELALGYNIIVAYMPWEGYNYEDAILLSENLIKRDIYTSIHIDEHQCDARDTKLGREEVTRDIPNVSEDALVNLDEDGVIRIGADVRPGDILVGKVTPKGETELTAEERLLRAIFGEKAREVRDTSLRVPHGESGKIVDVKTFTRDKNDEMSPGVNKQVRVYIAQKRKISVGDKMSGRHGNKGVVSRIMREEDMPFLPDGTPVDIVLNPLGVPSRMNIGQVLETHLGMAVRELGLKIADNPQNVAELLKVLGYDAEKYGLPKCEEAGLHVATPVFDGAREEDVIQTMKLAGINENGKTILYDGRTGEPFENDVTVGCVYMLKLHHLVDDKIHARSTGPYSLVTQQPLGGKAQFGGQRFGEMEVWALEAYGASYTLQEILTVKSDDVVGRVKAYEAIVKGKNIPEPGVPESFKVLIKELQSIGLDIKVLSGDSKEIVIRDDDDDDDRTIRDKASEHGVDVGNYGNHEVPVPPKPESDDIVADNVSELTNLVPDVKFTSMKDHAPSDADILKLKNELSADSSYDNDANDDFAPLTDEDDFTFGNDEPGDDDIRKVEEEEEQLYRRNRRKKFRDDDYDDLDFSRNDDDYSDDDRYNPYGDDDDMDN